MNKYIFIIVILFFGCHQQDQRVTLHKLENWQFQYKGAWHTAEVPGNNFSDLLYHGFISDPFYGVNEDSVQWVAEKKWVYRTNFASQQANNQALIFRGLDTYANVYLNDSLILESNNMFRTYEINVSSLLKSDNTLQIHFLPPNIEEGKKMDSLGYKLPGGNRVFTRKAGFHYGWDWGPKISTAGIWRAVELQSWDHARIIDFHIEQESLNNQKATLNAEIKLEIVEPGNYQLNLNDSVHKLSLLEGTHQLQLSYTILNPQKWWPASHGEQKLYAFDLVLIKDNNQLHTKSQQIGLRTIELITENEEGNETFYFEINGKPIFMKGANYIPQDNLQNRVTGKHYRELLQDVKNANMNMLRVWGGGIYEEDIFYNLCDSLGILVWQDFMFACAMYPSDSLFLENIKEEARQNVMRLRNHPSIALWCGNNENSEGWHRWGWQDSYSKEKKEEIWEGYKKIFQDILPNIVASYSAIDYWESSPKFGRGNPRHQFEGDAHYWGVWHDSEPFENFEKKIPRFMSEFGFQSFPQLSTIAQFADSSQWHLDSQIMKNHQKHPRGNSLILEYMQREYPIPEDFNKFIYASQILQAEGMRIGLEAHRRSQPYCMGTLYWQLNDCWPVASWSSRDYYGNWKALHYVVQDVFAPITLSLSMDEDGFINLWAISQMETVFSDTFVIRLYDMQGNELLVVNEEVVNIETGAQLLKDKISNYEQGNFMICELKNKGVKSKILFTSLVKDMNFEEPKIETKWEGDSLILSANIPAFQVYLHGIKGSFSDNFFTLLPGEEKLVTIKADNFNVNNLLIWSLFDLKK